jgi:hypothetical protein
MSKLALGPRQPPVQLVPEFFPGLKQLGHEVNPRHPPPPLHAFMWWAGKIYLYLLSTCMWVVTALSSYSYSNMFQCFWSIIREYTYTNFHGNNEVYIELLNTDLMLCYIFNVLKLPKILFIYAYTISILFLLLL